MGLHAPLRVATVVMLAVVAGCGSRPENHGTATAGAKPTPAQSHPFRGRVETVDKPARSVLVAGDTVEGWMAAMTMPYAIAPPEALDKLAAGDQITATVYDGDFTTLHDVKIVPIASTR